MTNTNAEQTNHTAAANDAAVICRHKSFLRDTLGLCRISGFGDGCVFS